MTLPKLSKDATTYLLRCHAMLDVVWRPIRAAFQTPHKATAILAARADGLTAMRGPSGNARHWKRSQRSRESLGKLGLMANGELTPEGKLLVRSWVYAFERVDVIEAVRRIRECVARNLCRKGGLVPECMITGCEWGGGSFAFASLQACLNPLLIDGLVSSRSTTAGHAFYQLSSAVDIDGAIDNSLPPVDSDLREDLFGPYDAEVAAVKRWLANAKEYHQEIYELPIPVAEPLLDEKKQYDAGDFGPLFPADDELEGE
jgi:hypothetical protein